MTSTQLPLTFNTIKNNIPLVKTIIANTVNKKVDLIKYNDGSEGGQLLFFKTAKTDVNNIFEAFIILWTYQLHHFEYWDLADNNPQDIENIVNLWMFEDLTKEPNHILGYSVESFNFYPTNTDSLFITINNHTKYIINELKLSLNNEKTSYDKQEVGIFLNDKRMDYDNILSEFNLDKILSAMELSDDWNDIQYFYETDDSYVFVQWWTTG